MVEDSIKIVAQHDPQIARVLSLELKRQRENLELIASENIVSPAVMAAMNSVSRTSFLCCSHSELPQGSL